MLSILRFTSPQARVLMVVSSDVPVKMLRYRNLGAFLDATVMPVGQFVERVISLHSFSLHGQWGHTGEILAIHSSLLAAPKLGMNSIRYRPDSGAEMVSESVSCFSLVPFPLLR